MTQNIYRGFCKLLITPLVWVVAYIISVDSILASAIRFDYFYTLCCAVREPNPCVSFAESQTLHCPISTALSILETMKHFMWRFGELELQALISSFIGYHYPYRHSQRLRLRGRPSKVPNVGHHISNQTSRSMYF